VEVLLSEVLLSVDGMSCQHCVQSVKQALRILDGVREVTVDLTAKTVRIQGSALNRAVLAETIAAAGFAVEE